MLAHDPGKGCAISTMVVENEEAHPLLQSLKMEEDQRENSVNQYSGLTKFNAIIFDIPGRQICPDILDRLDAWKPRRNFLQISLIGEAFPVNIIVAPFDTSHAPPS